MSVSAIIHLPHEVKVRDVADAMGVLAGLPIIQKKINHYSFKQTEGVYFSGHVYAVPQCVFIDLFGEMVDGSSWHRAVYSFEPEDEENSKSLKVNSTPFWLAVGHRLIQFFGGRMVCQDWGSSPKIFRYPTPTSQGDIFSLDPISAIELDNMAPFAAYSGGKPNRLSEVEITETMKILNIVKPGAQRS